jgi:glycosyltransferase involved in cell wall biosynthesis
LVVIGSGVPSNSILKKMEENGISFSGKVNSVSEYYEQAAICIVPLLSGSGTRLKVLEAMSLGVPIVSTEKGAEGISYTNSKDILIANKSEEFVERIQTLLENVKLRIEIASNARKLIEAKYDWSHIGGLMTNSLNESINK